ncbi:MAG: hypothetical protein ARM1_0494 [Candidatus Micrarchaeota archaeon]|nr:MAG: hypothetical protein ARM1_0494 [Candidatus Micrarchaeota archaeon]
MIEGIYVKGVSVEVKEHSLLSRQMPPRMTYRFDSLETKDSKATIKFGFVADYLSPDNKEIAKMEINGDVLISDDESKIKDIEKLWNEKKQVPNEVSEQILSLLAYTCSGVGTLVSYSLGLLPPILVAPIKLEPPK